MSDPQEPYHQQPQYQQPGLPGYSRVPDPPRKKKKKKGGKGKAGKESGGEATANIGATIGIWVLGIGLPILLGYFLITKVFMREEPMAKNPFPPAELTRDQLAACETWARQLALDLTEGRQDDVHKAVLYDALVYRTQVAFHAGRDIRYFVRDQVNALISTQVPGIFSQVLMGADRIPTQVLRLSKRAGYPCVTLRTMPKAERLLYYDLLVHASGNEFKIVDLYDWTFGVYASEVARRTVLIEMPTDLKSLKPWQTVFGEDVDQTDVLKLKGLLQEDILHRPSALDTIDTLGATARKAPDIYSMELKALVKLNDAGTTQPRVDRLTALLENPPLHEGHEVVTGVLLSEILQKAGKLPEAEAALRKAGKLIGGDAMIHVINGQRKLAAGDVPGADLCAREAAKENPKLPELGALRSQIEAKKAPK